LSELFLLCAEFKALRSSANGTIRPNNPWVHADIELSIEQHGLGYTQHGESKNSKHFDFTPLKTALNNYVDGFEQLTKDKNWTAIESAWMNVGKAQRDIPAHVAHEYWRSDRSFDPTPSFSQDNLPRDVTYQNFYYAEG
jgi:hypothetical protein